MEQIAESQAPSACMSGDVPVPSELDGHLSPSSLFVFFLKRQKDIIMNIIAPLIRWRPLFLSLSPSLTWVVVFASPFLLLYASS